jgi:O-antigen/teichoic acid export membrane protein
MNADPAASRETSRPHLLLGGTRVFLAESLLLPTGLIIAAVLARRLGPEGYGIFTVTAAVIAWIEWSLTALFSRASVRFVADTRDWSGIGSTIVSFHLFLAVIAALLLALLAGPVSALLGTRELAGPLRLFAADIPPFCLAQAHRNILIGLGDFGERALAAAARWVSRLVLVIVFVELGLSVDGAILGSIGASLVELAVCRAFVRPRFSARAALRFRHLWGVAAPLLLSAIALRLFDKLDLIALVGIGGSPREGGIYGAAQNLSLLPSLFALSFTPLLLSTLTRMNREGLGEAASRLNRDAMRWVFLLIPLVALALGSAREIVGLVFGPAFSPAATLLPPLLFAAVAVVLVSVTTSILIAADRLGLTLALTAPLPVVAGVGYLVLIPRAGAEGAAAVTFGSATLAAFGLVLAVHRVCGVLPPATTALRCSLVAGAAYVAASAWPSSGVWLGVKLATIGVGILIALLLTREITVGDLTAIRLWGRSTPYG